MNICIACPESAVVSPAADERKGNTLTGDNPRPDRVMCAEFARQRRTCLAPSVLNHRSCPQITDVMGGYLIEGLLCLNPSDRMSARDVVLYAGTSQPRHPAPDTLLIILPPYTLLPKVQARNPTP